MHPILSVTGIYNYRLAKWLDEKLKALSTNKFTVSDIFKFANCIHSMEIEPSNILVSYDVISLLSALVDKVIMILVEKAFKNNCFNNTYDAKITKDDLKSLLEITAKNQFFQFNGKLFKQINGVAMGSLLGPLMANTFMYYIKEKLQISHQRLAFCKRYVDNTLTTMPNTNAVITFLSVLNEVHSLLNVYNGNSQQQ